MKKLFLFIFFAIIFLNPSILLAERSEISSAEELQYLKMYFPTEVLVKASTKTSTPLNRVPNSVSVITREQIKRSGASTLPELLRLVPGVNVRWNPMVQTIDIRGFGQNPFTNRVLLLIDGIPYNSWNKGGFPQHPGFDFFVLQNVKQIEIIKGPGSALYGENAYWGIINIKTISGEDIKGFETKTYRGARKSTYSNTILGKEIGDDGSILISHTYFASQFPVKIWFDDNSNSMVTGNDLFLKGRYKELELSYYRHEDETEGFTTSSGFNSVDKLEQVIDIVALNFEHSSMDEKIKFEGDISFASREGSHCGGCHAATQNAHFNKKENHGFQAIGDFRAIIRSDSNNEILIGFEHRKIDTKEHAHDMHAQTTFQDDQHDQGLKGVVTRYNKTAIYFQDILPLMDNKLNIIASIRYDGKTRPSLFDDQISPRLALTYQPTNDLTLRTGWGTAHHFPDLGMLYRDMWFFNVNGTPYLVFKPNPDLTPETIQNFDLGAEYEINNKLTAKLDLFISQINDYIVQVENSEVSPRTLKWENHPDLARIYGSELEFRWEISPKINGMANWSFQQHQRIKKHEDSAGRQIEFVYAPKHKINLGLYLGPFTGLRGSLEVEYRDKRKTPEFWQGIRTSAAPLEDYTNITMGAGYDVPLKIGDQNPITLNFLTKNLLNQRREETFVGVDGTLPGREYFVGINFSYKE